MGLAKKKRKKSVPDSGGHIRKCSLPGKNKQRSTPTWNKHPKSYQVFGKGNWKKIRGLQHLVRHQHPLPNAPWTAAAVWRGCWFVFFFFSVFNQPDNIMSPASKLPLKRNYPRRSSCKNYNNTRKKNVCFRDTAGVCQTDLVDLITYLVLV